VVTSVSVTSVARRATLPSSISSGSPGFTSWGSPLNKDEVDLRWALNTGCDLVALSFVRTGDDITRVHEIMDEEGRRVPVIAKIEKPQAVE
jgi:pyruvate kinase